MRNVPSVPALPSITGLLARAPISPKPSTALPLVTTATRFAAGAVFKDVVWVFLDFQAGIRNSRSVGEAKILLGLTKLGGGDFDLSRARTIRGRRELGAW